MKKIKFIIAILVFALACVIGQSSCYAKSKVNVYLFKGEGCPHCEEALEWFNNELSKDSEYSDYYKLVEYEVWYDEENNELMNSVAKELGTNATGVPFIVIGDKYFSGFSSANSPEEIKEAIKTQYDNKNYQDVVEAVKKGTTLKNSKDDNSILPIIIVSAIAIVAVIGLVFFTKEK